MFLERATGHSALGWIYPRTNIHDHCFFVSAARSEIRATREHYLPVATRAAIIYFTLVDLPCLDVMYQFSLQWFVDLFVTCLLSLRSSAREADDRRATSPLLGTLQAGSLLHAGHDERELKDFM